MSWDLFASGRWIYWKDSLVFIRLTAVVKSSSSSPRKKKETERSNNRRNHITAQLSSRREITLDPSSQHHTPNHPSDCILKWWNAIILVILFRTPWAEQFNVASATTARSSRADCRCCFCVFFCCTFLLFLYLMSWRSSARETWEALGELVVLF